MLDAWRNSQMSIGMNQRPSLKNFILFPSKGWKKKFLQGIVLLIGMLDQIVLRDRYCDGYDPISDTSLSWNREYTSY
jgi:hypothetical protein